MMPFKPCLSLHGNSSKYSQGALERRFPGQKKPLWGHNPYLRTAQMSCRHAGRHRLLVLDRRLNATKTAQDVFGSTTDTPPAKSPDNGENPAPVQAKTTHRRAWSEEEDKKLRAIVNPQTASNWVRIASMMSSRTPKQCRERYHQHLKRHLNHDPISPEEGEMIVQLVQELGKRRAEIANRLNGRSEGAVKGWWNWNGSQNRRHARRAHPSNPYCDVV